MTGDDLADAVLLSVGGLEAEVRRLGADSERLRLLVEAQEWAGYAECLGGDEGVCPWCGTLKVQGAFGKPPGSHEPDCPAFTPTGDVK